MPWYGNFWDRNFFAETLPFLEGVLASAYAGGAVTGVGLVRMVAGLAELGGAFASRRQAPAAPQRPTLRSDR